MTGVAIVRRTINQNREVEIALECAWVIEQGLDAEAQAIVPLSQSKIYSGKERV